MNATEKRDILTKLIILLEDALSIERLPSYPAVEHHFRLSTAIRDEILAIAERVADGVLDGTSDQLKMLERICGLAQDATAQEPDPNQTDLFEDGTK